MAQKTDLAAMLAALTPEQIEALCKEDFALFVQEMYREVHAGEDLVWGPYLDLICSRLEDVAHGRLKHLIITLPPRHLKSFCVSVALPAYFLGHYPEKDVMCVSYGQVLAKGFALDCQTIMQSAAYRHMFGVVLKSNRQSLNTLRTRKGGIRRATSLDGTATGVGGDLIIFDDPQKAGETLSEAVRRATNETYSNTFVSRGNNPMTACKVIVMQRLHEDDFVGHVLGLGEKWDIINLPAIAEVDQAIPFKTTLGPGTFRRSAGEALHPARVPLEMLLKFRDVVGDAIWASQYQQRPAPAGGGLVKVEWFRRYDDADLPEFDYVFQSWDTANTVKDSSAYSVCTTWGVKGKHLWLLHVVRRRMIYPDLKRAVIAQADLHGADWVLVEDHASGTQLLQELRQEGFGKLRAVKPVHDKETRMVNQTAIIEAGRVHIPREAPWLADYLHELAVFPNGRFADQVDSTSQALASINEWKSGFAHLEIARQDQEAKRAHDEEILVLKGPPSVSSFNDIDGETHRPLPDGQFYLTRVQAGRIVNYPGWTLVRTIPAGSPF